MQNRKTDVFLVLLVLAALAVSGGAALRSRSGLHSSRQRPEDKSSYPIADADAPDPTDAKKILKRKAKNKKYREYHKHVGSGVVRAVEIYHWPPGFPTLPVAQSDAVIIGEVTDASAYLTEDKSSVYSEFTVCVEEILKNDQPPLAVGESVTLDRPGGRVRYSNGRISQFSLAGFGMPLVGGRYVFFIKGDTEEDYQMITAYEIRNGRIYPLDKTTSSDTEFEIHANADERQFLDKLRQLSRTLSDQHNVFRYRAKVYGTNHSDLGRWAYDVFLVTANY